MNWLSIDNLTNDFRGRRTPSGDLFQMGMPKLGSANESQVVFQGLYDVDSLNMVQLKLHTVINPANYKEAFFECSGFSKADAVNRDFYSLAAKAHDNVNNTYKLVIKTL